jgi:protein-S-isoprenylcysteine O-methyltransferase Ste14
MSAVDDRLRIDAGRSGPIVLALGLLVVLSLSYALVLGQPVLPWVVAWTGVALSAVLLYLLWRFVRAIERIASALEG